MNVRIARLVLICTCASWASLAMWLPLRAQVEPSDPQSARALRVQAAGPDLQTSPAPRAQIELAPASRGDTDTAKAAGVYFRRTHRIAVDGGPVVLRSSQSDGALRTDDAVRIEVERPDGEHRVWEHDFRDAATGAIVVLAPRRIDALFTRGVHTVTIELLDLRPPRHSSTAYVLVGVTAVQRTTDGGATADRRLPTAAMPTALPKTTDDGRPTTVGVTALPKTTDDGRLPTAVGVTALPKTTGDRRQPTAVGTTAVGGLPSVVGITAIVAAVMMSVLLAATRRTTPMLNGLLTLQDLRSGQRIDHVDLVQFGRRAWIICEPLGLKATAPGGGAAVGRLELDAAMACVLTSDAGVQRVLRDGDVVTLGDRVRLTYRAPDAITVGMTEAVR